MGRLRSRFGAWVLTAAMVLAANGVAFADVCDEDAEREITKSITKYEECVANPYVYGYFAGLINEWNCDQIKTDRWQEIEREKIECKALRARSCPDGGPCNARAVPDGPVRLTFYLTA